jgi:hypothetical protein
LENRPALSPDLVSPVDGPKSDIGSLIMDSLHKAYDQYKKSKWHRLALYVANDIASSSRKSGKFETALR